MTTKRPGPGVNGEAGAAMVAVLIIGVILSILCVGLFYTMSTTIKRSGSYRVTTTALNIAEAGKEHALSSFRAGSIVPVAGATTTLFNNLPFGSGSYSVQSSANSAGDTLWVTSTGNLGTVQKTIKVTFAVTGCPVPTDSAYNYGLVAGGSITWSGSGTCNTGAARLQTNSSFGMSGSSNFTCSLLAAVVQMSMSGSGNITGSVKSPVISRSGSGKISGTSTISPVASVPIPAIDLTPYYTAALANGQVFSGKTISGSSSTTVPGGIMWVNGDFNYSGSGNVTGSIIATGNVSISGSGNFSTVNSYPAIVSSAGNITMSGSGKVLGLIYAKVGQITKSGSGDVTGSLICGGAFSKNGSWNTLTYQKSIPVPPGCNGTTYNQVAWQEL